MSQAYTHDEFHLVTEHNVLVPYAVCSFPTPGDEAPRAVLGLIHGFGEHGGRYVYLAEYLWETAKIALLVLEWDGHGETVKKQFPKDTAKHLGVIHSRARIFDAVSEFIDYYINDKYPGIPKFFGGHSMGGCFALGYMMARGARHDGRAKSRALAGVVYMSPYLDADDVNVLNKLTGSVLMSVSSTFQLSVGIKQLTSCDKENQIYSDDPEVHNKISASLINVIHHTQAHVIGHKTALSALSLPQLFFHGELDKLALIEPSKQLFQENSALKPEQFASVFVDGAYHEVCREPEAIRIPAFEKLAAFLNAQL